MVYYRWESRSSGIAYVTSPGHVTGGRGILPGSGGTIGDEKQRPVRLLSCHAGGAPPQQRKE